MSALWSGRGVTLKAEIRKLCSVKRNGPTSRWPRTGQWGYKALFAAIATGVAFGFCGCVSVPHDAGPLSISDKDLRGHSRLRVLGPFIETRYDGEGKRFHAVRPFYSRTEDSTQDRTVSDIVWPLGMVKERQGETDWRFLLAFGHDFDSEDSGSRHRWNIFPLFFGGEDAAGDRYFAAFPFGGTLHEFLMRDRITFALFPLYAYSEQADNKTHSVLWPFCSRTVGDDVYRLRVFPFYGISENQDRWTKRFVMWPFWTSVDYHYPGEKGGGYVLFPLFGKTDVGDRHSRMFLPPFFKWERGEDGHRALNCPWPLFQYRRGEIDRFYIWPLFGRESRKDERRWFTLWPIVSGRRTERSDGIGRRFRIVPLVYYASKAHPSLSPDEPDAVFSRYFKLWPLVSYRREEDTSRLRLLALWPMKHTAGIERNWAPLWSLYSRERVGMATESEFLWGLYRRRRTEESRSMSVFPLLQTSSSTADEGRRSWSLLYGLIGYKREGLRKQLRMLYFLKFGRLDKPSAATTLPEPSAGTNDAIQVVEQS